MHHLSSDNTAELRAAVKPAARMTPRSRELTSPGAWRHRAMPGRSHYRRLRTDHLVRNSLYLILSSGLQACLGFAFWIITARLFSTADVGRASSLISATTVIAYLALLGF